MTTAFFTHSARPSGAELGVTTLLASWPPDEVAPVLVLGEDGDVADRARAGGVRVRIVELPVAARRLSRHDGPRAIVTGLRGLVSAIRAARALLTDIGPDVVVAFTLKALLVTVAATARSRTRVVWSLHDRVTSRYMSFPQAVVMRHLLPRLVDGMIVNSRSTLATVRPATTPVLVSHPAVDLPDRQPVARREGVREVVSVGRLAPWKGQDVFLRAFARVFGGTHVRAVVVGGPLFGEDAFETSLRALAVDLGVAEQVTFTGHVDDPWPHLFDADVMVHSSVIPEPFGQVVVQGMWAGCAVVATSPGGPAEVVEDGVDGLLVGVGDHVALCRSLERLRDDHELRLDLARTARTRVVRFDPGRAAEDVASWIGELASPTPRRMPPLTLGRAALQGPADDRAGA